MNNTISIIPKQHITTMNSSYSKCLGSIDFEFFKYFYLDSSSSSHYLN